MQQLADQGLEPGAKTDRFGRHARTLAYLTFALRQSDRQQVAPSDAEHREVEVVLDAESEEEPRRLKGSGQAGAGAMPRRVARHVPAEKLDPALGRRELAGDDVEQGRLPGPVGPEDGAPLAGLDRKSHIRDCTQAAEPPADPPQVEDRLSGFGFLHRESRSE